MVVNVHLHSGQENIDKRNSDFAQIMGRFVHGIDDLNQVVPMSRMPDVLLFMGDLNYRVNGYKDSIVKAMSTD